MSDDPSFWDTLDPRYQVILCDVWGVIHNGKQIYPGAAEWLLRWREEGRCVVLITNAPRPAASVERSLARLGLPREAWDAVASSGEAGIAALASLGRPVGFLGTAPDLADFEGRGIRIAEDEDWTDLVCTGFEEHRWEIEDYAADLERWAARSVTMHCLNPDRVVVYGSRHIPCAGAIADVYEAIGGKVAWYGKPYPAIYEHALRLAGDPAREQVLAIGDGLQTDVLGAARMGFDAVFVSGGIHSGEPFPEDFGERHGLGSWRPVAVVESLR
jgi:HAD superfamily hydrolase (TIGR01459 family)